MQEYVDNNRLVQYLLAATRVFYGIFAHMADHHSPGAVDTASWAVRPRIVDTAIMGAWAAHAAARRAFYCSYYIHPLKTQQFAKFFPAAA